MTPRQRAEAEHLADWLEACGVVNSEVRETIALLRELLAEPMRCPEDGGTCGAGGYCREPGGESIDALPAGLLTVEHRPGIAYSGAMRRYEPILSLPDGEHKLYLHPPQREPLTDEQLDALAMDDDGLPNSHLEFARAIERAHGIREKA